MFLHVVMYTVAMGNNHKLIVDPTDHVPLICIHSQTASEKDFLDAIQKVIKQYAKFSSTPRYMTYN